MTHIHWQYRVPEEEEAVLAYWYMDESEQVGEYSHAVLCGVCKETWSYGGQCLWYSDEGLEVEGVEYGTYDYGDGSLALRFRRVC